MAITSPYNFVPINREVYSPSWAKDVSMDIPFEDGEDGIIELTIENESPLFTRNGHAKESENPDKDFSSHIMVNGQRKYFIPGSTVKGCVRNVLEVFSHAKMERYDDDSFGMQRDFGKDTDSGKIYRDRMSKFECRGGWMKKIGETEDGDIFVIEPCQGSIQKIRHNDIDLLFENFNHGEDHKTAQIKFKRLPEPFPIVDVESGTFEHITPGQYRLVCTGHFNKKESEYLFPVSLGAPLQVSPRIARQFTSIHKHTEYFGGKNGNDGFLTDRLEKGLSIPVFFEEHNGEVCSIGITRFYRYPQRNSVSMALSNGQNTTESHDLPETMFGYATNSEEDASLRGRVHFGHAFMVGSVADNECVPFTTVLGEPKPSYYPLYLRQDVVNQYKTYDDEKPVIAGRKRYRIHPGGHTSEPILNENNRNVGTTFRPLPPHQTFVCRIAVHNLRKVELGALLSALTFNGDDSLFHNLGMAKSMGYGKCKFSISNISGFKYSVTEYLQAFEAEMLAFVYHAEGSTLSQDKSIQALLQIASEQHAVESLRTMELKEYRESKKTRNYSTLDAQEPEIKLILHIDEDKQVDQMKKDDWTQYIQSKLFELDQSCDIVMTVKDASNLKIETANHSFDESFENQIKQMIDNFISEKTTVGPAPTDSGTESKSLVEFIPKATGFGQLTGRVKAWLKNEQNTIGPDEVIYLADKMLEAFVADKIKTKDIIGQWLDPSRFDRKWAKLIDATDRDITMQVFEELKKRYS